MSESPDNGHQRVEVLQLAETLPIEVNKTGVTSGTNLYLVVRRQNTLTL